MTPERLALTRQIIEALFEMLPPTGSVWPLNERKQWLDAVGAVLVLGYGVDGGVRTKIEDGE